MQRRTDAPNAQSCHTARASRENLAQSVDIIDIYTKALEDRDGGDAYNVDDYIESEEGELKVDHELSETTEYPLRNF